MFEKLEALKARFQELNTAIAEPEIIADYPRYQDCLKQLEALRPTVESYNLYLATVTELDNTQQLLQDPEFAEIADAEVKELTARRDQLLEKLKLLLVPPDPMDDRNVVLELRAGAGGEEAALFCGDLLRMYRLYAMEEGLNFEVLSLSDSDLGGINEALISVTGAGAYAHFRYESGVHCVKRVPVTESSGRIQTSTVTAAVLPEATEIEITIDPNDIKTDVYHATGHGGQGVNTTDSAVRLTHLPTGLVVTCQDERSQLENKAKAMKVLRSRLLDRMQETQDNAYAADRRSQVGTGGRSERIRTYYFNHDYVVDHRLGLTVNRIAGVMNGGLKPFTEALQLAAKTEKLKSLRLKEG